MKVSRKAALAAGLLCLCILAGCGSAASASVALPTPTCTPVPTPTAVPSPTPSPTPRPTDCVAEDGAIHIYLYGAPELADTAKSSWIDGLRYYPASGHLIMETNGREYVFANVSPEVWAEFSAAPSLGKYYNSHFKGNHDYWVIGYDGTNGERITVHDMG